MPDLRIQTAIDNGDLPKDNGRSFKDITLEQATNPTVMKYYYEQFKKEFGRPSVFASPTKTPRSDKT
jgi:hypothetical protein